jgi:hypothetical protein
MTKNEMRVVNYCEMEYLTYKPLVPAAGYSAFFQPSLTELKKLCKKTPYFAGNE